MSMPALLIRASRGPQAATAWRTRRSQSAGWETSVGATRVSPPRSRQAAATCSRASASRAARVRRAPRPASSRHTALPMPWEAPVTMMELPARPPAWLLARLPAELRAPACVPLIGPSSLEVPRDVDQGHALEVLEQEARLQDLGAVVVEEGLVPVPLHQLGDDDGDLARGVVLLELPDEVDQRLEEPAVGGRQDDQPRRLAAIAARRLLDVEVPLLLQRLPLRLADPDVDRADVVRDPQAPPQRLRAQHVPGLERHHDDWL